MPVLLSPTRLAGRIMGARCGCAAGLFLLAASCTLADQTNLVFGLTQTWRFQQTTNLDGVNWTAPGFDDSGWPSGAGVLADESCGCLPAAIATPLNVTNGRTTFYFRAHFAIANPTGVTLILSNLIDDGAVFHLNGVEVKRVRMPAAPAAITYATTATDTPSSGDATSYDAFVIGGELCTNLVAGDNVLAVEVHQASTTSSDVAFGAALFAVAPSASERALIPMGALWKYLDDGSDQGAAWRGSGFDDTSWASGIAQLGYGDGDEMTIVNGGPDTNHFITTYFRRAFTITDPSPIKRLTVRLLCDDGAVVYLNGQEIMRENMAGGAISYLTLAAEATDNEGVFIPRTIGPAGLLQTGTNLLAVEIHQANATSSDISFDLQLIGDTNDFPPVVIRGPYLQNGSPTNVVVRWRTDLPSPSRVRCGTSLNNLSVVADDPLITTEHEVNLQGLQPDTKYFYAVGTPMEILAGSNANHAFFTAPTHGSPKPSRVWVLGDAGTQTANQIAVRDAFEAFNNTNRIDLWLMLGDNAYANGLDSEYQAAVFNTYTNMLRKSVLWPALGNHDTAQSLDYNGVYTYFSIFTLPRNGEAGGVASGTEHYYSYDYANVHFICLDSMTANRATNGPMATWLRADLADNLLPWVVAYWHHPPYSKGSHDSDTELELIAMRQNFLPILEAGGVDLVLCGHSHAYERSCLISEHYGPSTTFQTAMKLQSGSGRDNQGGAYRKPENENTTHYGAVYAVAGSSGQISGGALNHPVMFTSTNQLGSMVLDFNGNRLDAKFIRENGEVTDYFTIVKTNFAPYASNLSFAISADTPTNLALSASDLNGKPLTFATAASPERGLISNFTPATGAMTYTPARAYLGPDKFTYRASNGDYPSPPATISLNIAPQTDADTDGLPDAWESFYGANFNPLADNDGDGASNLAEYLANTNPTNAASFLKITSVARDNAGHTTLVWTAVGGTRYRISYANVANAAFADIVRAVALEMNPAAVGVSTNQSFTDDYSLTGGSPPTGARFYRVRVVQ